ncbi:hypothetical protein X975_19679, partial [Stegodyphus mimosarum]
MDPLQRLMIKPISLAYSSCSACRYAWRFRGISILVVSPAWFLLLSLDVRCTMNGFVFKPGMAFCWGHLRKIGFSKIAFRRSSLSAIENLLEKWFGSQ